MGDAAVLGGPPSAGAACSLSLMSWAYRMGGAAGIITHFNALLLAQRPLEMTVDNESLAGVVTECDEHPTEVAE